MNGQVFQLQLEQKKKGQFQETLDQLQIYASSNYKKDIKHLKILFTELRQPAIVKPEARDNMTKGEQLMFAEQARQYIKDSRSLEPSLASLYNVVWGQCSRLLQNKLKSSNKYNEFDNNCDVASLLTEIKKLSSKLEENTSAYDALRESKVKFYRYQQSEEETLANHMRNFKELVSSVEYHGGDIFFDRDMMENEIREDKEKDMIKTTPEGYRNRTIEKSKTVAFIKSTNKKNMGVY